MFQQSATSENLSTSASVADNALLSADKTPTGQDPFLDHYFKRIDPQLAASFSTEQREAIKTMFGARGIAKHAVEVRRSLPFGRRRYYLVLLFGREQRTFVRLYKEGMVSSSSSLLGYLITAALWLLPAVGAALLLQAIL